MIHARFFVFHTTLPSGYGQTQKRGVCVLPAYEVESEPRETQARKIGDLEKRVMRMVGTDERYATVVGHSRFNSSQLAETSKKHQDQKGPQHKTSIENNFPGRRTFCRVQSTYPDRIRES